MKIRMAIAAAASLAAVAGPASANGANVGFAGTSIVQESVGTTAFFGHCTYTRTAIGIGGSGVTYDVVGVGTAGGAYNGIPVVATGIKCRLLLPSVTVVSGPEYLPGPVAETNTSYTTNDASGGQICTTVYAVLRQTPPGMPTNQIASRETCR